MGQVAEKSDAVGVVNVECVDGAVVKVVYVLFVNYFVGWPAGRSFVAPAEAVGVDEGEGEGVGVEGGAGWVRVAGGVAEDGVARRHGVEGRGWRRWEKGWRRRRSDGGA